MDLKTKIFSRRWGHDDPYTFTKTADGWEIKSGGHECTCAPDGTEPNAPGRGGIIALMHNDRIYPPTVIDTALEWLWDQIESKSISEPEAHKAIDELANWISDCQRTAPRSGAWQTVF